MIKFPYGFDIDMSYQLRERNSPTLEAMKRYFMSVEANLQAKRARMKIERRVTIREETSTYAVDAKIDSLVRTMERMMGRISLNEGSVHRETNLFHRTKIQILEETLHKSDKEIKEAEINKLGLHFKKSMLMKMYVWLKK